MNEIAFLDSFLANSLSVYENATNFCVDFVYCNFVEFINQFCLLVESLGFSDVEFEGHCIK